MNVSVNVSIICMCYFLCLYACTVQSDPFFSFKLCTKSICDNKFSLQLLLHINFTFVMSENSSGS